MLYGGYIHDLFMLNSCWLPAVYQRCVGMWARLSIVFLAPSPPWRFTPRLHGRNSARGFAGQLFRPQANHLRHRRLHTAEFQGYTRLLKRRGVPTERSSMPQHAMLRCLSRSSLLARGDCAPIWLVHVHSCNSNWEAAP